MVWARLPLTENIHEGVLDAFKDYLEVRIPLRPQSPLLPPLPPAPWPVALAGLAEDAARRSARNGLGESGSHQRGTAPVHVLEV